MVMLCRILVELLDFPKVPSERVNLRPTLWTSQFGVPSLVGTDGPIFLRERESGSEQPRGRSDPDFDHHSSFRFARHQSTMLLASGVE